MKIRIGIGLGEGPFERKRPQAILDVAYRSHSSLRGARKGSAKWPGRRFALAPKYPLEIRLSSAE